MLAAEFMLCYCALYRYKSHTLIQFPPTEDFYSLEIFKISTKLRSFRKRDNFGGSVASISLITDIFFMKIYHN